MSWHRTILTLPVFFFCCQKKRFQQRKVHGGIFKLEVFWEAKKIPSHQTMFHRKKKKHVGFCGFSCEDIFAPRKLFTQQNKTEETQISSNDQRKKKRECIFLAFVFGKKHLFLFCHRNILTTEKKIKVSEKGVFCCMHFQKYQTSFCFCM